MKAGPDHTLHAALAALAMLGLIVATVAGTAAGLVTQLHLSPRVGDIVAFDPGQPVALDLHAAVSARRVRGGSCTLDTGFLSARTGSLIVEQANRPDGLERVHWAGGPTAAGAASCGRDAELLLRPSAIEQLAVAAGGFGVADKRMALASMFHAPNGAP
jgi:hypothetical protein